MLDFPASELLVYRSVKNKNTLEKPPLISADFQKKYIWAIYNDLTRPHPKWWFSKGNPLISGKSRLVKYYNLPRSFLLREGEFESTFACVGAARFKANPDAARVLGFDEATAKTMWSFGVEPKLSMHLADM